MTSSKTWSVSSDLNVNIGVKLRDNFVLISCFVAGGMLPFYSSLSRFFDISMKNFGPKVALKKKYKTSYL